MGRDVRKRAPPRGIDASRIVTCESGSRGAGGVAGIGNARVHDATADGGFDRDANEPSTSSGDWARRSRAMAAMVSEAFDGRDIRAPRVADGAPRQVWL